MSLHASITSQPSKALPILIIGAGISGLALAQGLLKQALSLSPSPSSQPPQFRIYERDASLNIRSQGYRVRLSSPGITALRTLLPEKRYERLEQCCAICESDGGLGPPVRLDALTGKAMVGGFSGGVSGGMNIGGPGGRAEPRGPRLGALKTVGVMEQPLNADRGALRSSLMEGLKEFVTFGKEFEKYELVEGGVKVRFLDGEEVMGSLLIGADGTKSKVRRQLLPRHKYVDTEGRWFYGKTTITPELLSRFHEQAKRKMTLVQDHTRDKPLSLLLEPVRFKDNELGGQLPDDYIYWVLGSRKDRFEMDDHTLLGLSPDEAVRETQKMTADWDDSFRVLFEMQDVTKTSILRIDSSRPELPVWGTQPSVTLMGDTIHAMSPTAGVGAVTALTSAALLAKVLNEEGVTVEGLRRYEDGMREVAGEAIRKSFFGGKMIFGMKSFDQLKEVTS